MSYILEALKKAQAERQLGATPTIHAPQPAQAPQHPAAHRGRRPLLLGLGGGVLVVAAAALLWWKQGAAPAPVAGTQAVVAVTPDARAAAAAPAASATLEVSAPPAPPAHAAARPAEPARQAAPAGRMADGSAAAAAPTAPPPRAAATPPAAVAQSQSQQRPPAGAVSAQAQRPSAAPAPEDSLPFLQQLPEPLRADVPRVAFGGYMYSANPADRLLLVDKTLRHEGEEVAPGLVLEKLLPRAAVMNYRGTRYRVAY